MLKLLDMRNRPEAMVGSTDVARAVTDRMDDQSLSHFVANSIIKERGATERLAHAFQALAPDAQRQRQLLGLAHDEVEASGAGGEGFDALWKRVETMLTSCSDEKFVSEQYGRELSNARTRARSRSKRSATIRRSGSLSGWERSAMRPCAASTISCCWTC